MAVFRQIHIKFWQDAFVLDLTPEEKYFYIYLMTNSKTSQCGIYELPKRIIETETGYNRETVDKLLKRFVEYGKIIYNEKSKEIIVINWMKFNYNSSVKVQACIKKELEKIKTVEFIKILDKKIKEINPKDKVCEPYIYPMDTVSIDYGEEKEQQQQKEKEKEQQKEQQQQKEDIEVVDGAYDDIKSLLPDCSESDIQKIYNAAGGNVAVVREKIKIINSMPRIRNFVGALITAIKEDWVVIKNNKKDSFNNYEQRTYDFDELEKQLLGE